MSLVVGGPADGAVDTVLKLIPGELLVLHTVVLVSATPTTPSAAIAILAGGVLVGIAVLAMAARGSGRSAPPAQYAVRSVVYLAWAATVEPELLQLDSRWIPAVAMVIPPMLGPWLFPRSGVPR